VLKLPGGKPVPEVPVLGRRVAKPERIVILPAPLLRATVKISQALKDAKEKWAFGGDAAEITKGVDVSADHLEIVATKAGTEEICKLLVEYVTVPPAGVMKKLPREANVESVAFPVYIKSHYAELTVDKIRVEVYGDLQYKVAEWEWGDPIDYKAEHVNILGANVPILPLRLKSELDMGLGWFDRVELISDAVIRGQHRR
jgi:aminoglycoside-2''-adenylyltransferase